MGKTMDADGMIARLAAGDTSALAAPRTDAPARAWPSELERQRDFFWTATVPRPDGGTWALRFPTLAEAQAIWDEAEAKRLRYEAGIQERQAERDRRDSKAKAQREADWLARQQATSGAREGELRGAYLASGGTPAGWEAEGPQILADDRRRRTLDGVGATRSLATKTDALG